MTYLILTLQLLTLAAVLAFVAWRLRWSVDLERVAGAIAADILERHEDVIYTLEPFGTRALARSRYLALCGLAGLPEGAADWVADRVWGYVVKAQNRRPETAGEGEVIALYE
jgi:hypothetical protein